MTFPTSPLNEWEARVAPWTKNLEEHFVNWLHALSGHLDSCLDGLGHTDVHSMNWLLEFLDDQVKGDPPMTETAAHKLTFASSTTEIMDAAFEAAMKLPSERDIHDSAHLTSSTIRLRHMMENMHAICVAGFSAEALAGYLLGELNNAGMGPAWHNYKVIDPEAVTRPEFEPSPPPQAPEPTEEPAIPFTQDELCDSFVAEVVKLRGEMHAMADELRQEFNFAELFNRTPPEPTVKLPPVPSEEGQLLLDAVRGFQSQADSAAEADETEWFEGWLDRMHERSDQYREIGKPEDACPFKVGDWFRWSVDPDAFVVVEVAPTGRITAIKTEGSDRGALRYFYHAQHDDMAKIEPGT